MTDLDYWKECISIAAEECGSELTAEQLNSIAGAVKAGHENYGQAFYSPPSSDRYNEIAREYEVKLKLAESRFDQYRENAETAIKQALHQRSDEHVSIESDGEVLRHGGRTDRIQ